MKEAVLQTLRQGDCISGETLAKVLGSSGYRAGYRTETRAEMAQRHPY
ncbi:hypothetical protein M1N02_00105 [Thermodesulfovibrionales bacterium]|nr:hypothetical protein [Thermodesulfovibrionales bacterium]